jgi:hypothetical protein
MASQLITNAEDPAMARALIFAEVAYHERLAVVPALPTTPPAA